MAKKKNEEKDKAAKPQPAWRAGLEFVRLFGAAILIALLIKAFVFDIYLIPSGSMETTLHGRPDGGDRIFCSKLSYRFRPLERWEVAVFEFPYEAARRTDDPEVRRQVERYKGQNFVKRVVGMPGESLAIGRGDIWVRAAGGKPEYQHMVKPHAVQRGIWLNVYTEDFSDLRRQELNSFWKVLGGEVDLAKGGPLVLKAGTNSIRMDYRPMVPAGMKRDTMVELPGIPDRYTLEQPVQFKCKATLPDGSVCGHVFVKTFWTQNMQARCPSCGSLQDETSAIFYHRRSGLPCFGRYAVDPAYAPQGEDDVSPRLADYHFVPDLRVVANLTLADEKSRLGITLRDDNRFAQALFSGDGRVEVRVNGEPSRPEQRALAEIRPGKSHRVEFYIVEGVARVLVDSEDKLLLELPVWNDKRPVFPRDSLTKSSGVSLTADGGEMKIAKLRIDRDIFYYTDWERERIEKFPQMSAQGEVFIGSDSFLPMGDHCTSSFDARSWGPVPMTLLRGPAIGVFWPPERIGWIASPLTKLRNN